MILCKILFCYLLHSFLYKHKLYKNTQAEKTLKIKHMLSIIRAWDLFILKLFKTWPLIRQRREKRKKIINKIQLTKLCVFWRHFNYLRLSWIVVTVNFWVCAWLIFLWKHTSFKSLHMFLASKLIKNLHTATFASMLMKNSGLHEAARGPFSICKHILSILWGWKRLFF